MTSISIKDAMGTVKTLAQQVLGGLYYGGHFSAAMPEGGATPYKNLDVETTGQIVKASAGQLYGGVIFNLAGANPSGFADRYLKIYNKATAPTNGDTPVLTIPLEAGVPTYLPATVCGIAFSVGIGIRATIGLADNDNNAPGTNEVVVNLLYA